MADQLISLKIPDAKVAKALEGFLKIYPNVEMTDDNPPVAKYTIKEWVTERIRRLIVKDIRRGHQMQADEDALVIKDDSLVENM